MSSNIGLIGPSMVSGVAAGDFSADQKHALGSIGYLKDGRLFRYCQAGVAPLVVGNLVQSAAPVTAHLANTPPPVPVGSTQFIYTPGAAAGAANLYAEGYLSVDTAPGNGYVYGVSGHGPISSGTAFTLYLDPDDPIRDTALSGTSRVGLMTNRWRAVIQSPATLTSTVAGGVVAPIPAGWYGWVQTAGPFAGLIVGTPAVNAPIISSATVPGGIDVWTATAQPTANLIGHMMQAGVGGKNNMVWLKID